MVDEDEEMDKDDVLVVEVEKVVCVKLDVVEGVVLSSDMLEEIRVDPLVALSAPGVDEL